MPKWQRKPVSINQIKSKEGGIMAYKNKNPYIKGFDDEGNPIGDPQMIMFGEQDIIMRDVYPSKNQLKDDEKMFNKPKSKKFRIFSKAEKASYKRGIRKGYAKMAKKAGKYKSNKK